MKHRINKKSILVVLTFCSIVSTVYLQLNAPIDSILESHTIVDDYVKEKTFMPEVKFVKELLKTIFNVINA